MSPQDARDYERRLKDQLAESHSYDRHVGIIQALAMLKQAEALIGIETILMEVRDAVLGIRADARKL